MIKHKTIPKEKLIIKESLLVFFRGGEIWGEHLDSLYDHKDIVLSKLKRDLEIMRKPSCSSHVALVLNETSIDLEITENIVNGLLSPGQHIRRLVIVGASRYTKKMLTNLLKANLAPFPYAFINDFEKAKEWLI